MAESATLLVDAVLPEQPVRHWVLSFPYPWTLRKKAFILPISLRSFKLTFVVSSAHAVSYIIINNGQQN
jgi:hypothetical protein